MDFVNDTHFVNCAYQMMMSWASRPLGTESEKKLILGKTGKIEMYDFFVMLAVFMRM